MAELIRLEDLLTLPQPIQDTTDKVVILPLETGRLNGSFVLPNSLKWNDLALVSIATYDSASGEVRDADVYDNELLSQSAWTIGVGVGQEKINISKFGENAATFTQSGTSPTHLYYVVGYRKASTIGNIKAVKYLGAMGANTSKTIQAETIPNGMLKEQTLLTVEIQDVLTGIWAESNWDSGIGVAVDFYGDDVVVRTGEKLISSAFDNGTMHPRTSDVLSAPVRVIFTHVAAYVRKLVNAVAKEYYSVQDTVAASPISIQLQEDVASPTAKYELCFAVNAVVAAGATVNIGIGAEVLTYTLPVGAPPMLFKRIVLGSQISGVLCTLDMTSEQNISGFITLECKE